MDKQQVREFINSPKNGLSEVKQVGSYTIQLAYQPKQLLKRKPENVNIENIEYFLITISDNGEEILTRFAGSKSAFNKMTTLLNFYMSDYIYLKDKEQKIKPQSCFQQATYGMADKTSLLVSFKIDETIKNSDAYIVIDEFGLKIGKQKFNINFNNIKKLSTIKFIE